MHHRFLWRLALSLLLLVLRFSDALITVNVSAEPSDVVVEYGTDTGEITCSYRVTPEAIEHPVGSVVTFASRPSSVTLILRNHYLDALILVKNVPFEPSMAYAFSLSNVRQSGRFSCDIASPELNRPARDFVRVYVRTDDDCDITQDLLRNKECFNEKSVCKPGHHLERRRRICLPVSSPRFCSPVDVCQQCSCRRLEKHIVRLPYREVADTNGTRTVPNVVSVDGRHFEVSQSWESCYECANNTPASRFMTALIVTFLVLLSGGVTVIGTAVLYDWCKRRRDLRELEREHTEVNPDAVEVEALRRVVEDRPPSYVESRKSDLHLAGVPPPSYEDIFNNSSSGNRDVLQAVTVSSPRLANVRGSVPVLEPIHERRLSI